MKKLLVIGFVWPEPKSSAAGSRMMQLILMFQEMDYQVTFASTAQNLEFSENLNNYNVTTASISLNDSSFDAFCKNLQPNIVLFDRFLTEEQFGWRVTLACKNAIKILDTEDLHSLRLSRQKAVNANKKFDKADLVQSDIAKREIASIYRCDLSLMVSEYEMLLLQELFLVPRFILCYLPILVTKVAENELAFDQRTDFVFIGNFLHAPNTDAVQHLYNKIWPKIHKELPNIKMQIYGAYPIQKITDLHKPQKNFIINGRADSASGTIKRARVILAPIRFGAGIKGKLLEAMEYGTPSITTSIGAESMHGTLSWNGFICDDDELFVKRAVEMYTSKTEWTTAKNNGYEIIKQRYLKSLFANDFQIKINELVQHFAQIRLNNFTGALLQHHTANSTMYMSKWIEEKNKKPL